MTTRQFMVMVLLGLAAALTFIASTNREEVADTDRVSTPIRSGYYMLDATIYGTDQSGEPLFVIEAAQAVQSGRGQPIQLSDIRIEYAQNRQNPWRIAARSGSLDESSNNLRLEGDVTATRSSDNPRDTVQLRTEVLSFDPLAEVVQTDALVSFRMGEGDLMATGMRASLGQNTVELRSNIRGQFTP
ncbi:MAG: LPS export ABC transporter periplasmic protein LptC [Pseudomonadota bacterium]